MARSTVNTVNRPPLFDGRDVTQLAARAGVGLLLIAIGWYQASVRLLLDDQRPWLSLAAGGLVIGCVSGALWILQLRRAVSIRAANLRRDVSRLVATEIRWPPLADGTSDVLVAPAAYGARFFHRPDCVLVSGHDTVTATDDEHHRAGRIPCETCFVPDPAPVEASIDE